MFVHGAKQHPQGHGEDPAPLGCSWGQRGLELVVRAQQGPEVPGCGSVITSGSLLTLETPLGIIWKPRAQAEPPRADPLLQLLKHRGLCIRKSIPSLTLSGGEILHFQAQT